MLIILLFSSLYFGDNASEHQLTKENMRQICSREKQKLIQLMKEGFLNPSFF